jgi:hypothetical protein
VFKIANALVGICIFVLGLGFSSAAWCDSPSKPTDPHVFPTNFGLLRLTVDEAIEEMCDRLPLHEAKILCLNPESEAPGNWLVERAFLKSLRRKDVRVMMPDSSGATACAARSRLSYRVVDLDLIYSNSRRRYPFAPRLVQREVRVHFLLKLNSVDGEILWEDETERSGGDWIPVKDLPYAEREGPPFISPRLKVDGWGRYVEPALLTAVVGGLIYLFYTTQ